jgi:DNA polymerase III alpha subunit
MNKEELTSFLESKLEELPKERKLYLKEELRAFKTKNLWEEILKLVNSNKKYKINKHNILSFYLLGISPEPLKYVHHWELADMADIDMDFSPEHRDEIKQWLKDKFGEENCVSIGTYGTLGVKMALQDLCRVLKIKPFEYIPITKEISADDKDLDIDEIKEKYPKIKTFFKKYPDIEENVLILVGMKRSVGQHAGGFVVSSDNVNENIFIAKSSKDYVTGWQESGAIKELEPTGFIKIDILGLSCVEQIKQCVDEINRRYPDKKIIDPYSLPVDDKKVYDFINTLELENIFQMESKVFKEAVKKIKPRTLQDISNISTLIRPGAADVDSYVKANRESRREPKCLSKVYGHTRGLMIYQEQLMQVLMELGGFSIFEADKVRRLIRKIGKEKTSEDNRTSMIKESEGFQKKYLEKAIKKIVEEDVWSKKEAENYAQLQWDQIMAQAKYAFNMPHSYAYSLMGYVQAYLKCYYPIEFWCSTLNTIDRGQEKHGQSTLGNYIYNITKSKIQFGKPDVNKSLKDFYGEDNKIYFALSYIKSVGASADTIISQRPYTSWEDFLEKAKKNKFNKRVVKSLVFSGALDFDDDMTNRPYKWLDYISERKNKKDRIKEQEETKKKFLRNVGTDKEKVLKYELVKSEYDLLKYSFTGISETMKGKKFDKYKNIPTVSKRDQSKKFFSILGYIDKIMIQKSKKSGNQYLLLTITDFQESLSIYVFGDQKNDIQNNPDMAVGKLIKVCVKNENGWIKLPWESELGGAYPIEIIR